MRALVVCLGVLAFASRAFAHDLGVSRMNLVERPDGSIHGQFVFAAREAEGSFDRDGHVAVDVKSDGVSCKPGPATSTPDGDGVIVEEDFACARATASIEATAYFVTEMDVARIETAESTHEELLRAPHRTILLEVHRKRAEPPQRGWIAAFAIAAVALIALAIRSILRRGER